MKSLKSLDLTILDRDDLLKAYYEIEKFNNTGILEDGLVRSTARSFCAETRLSMSVGMNAVTKAYYEEIATRWASDQER